VRLLKCVYIYIYIYIYILKFPLRAVSCSIIQYLFRKKNLFGVRGKANHFYATQKQEIAFYTFMTIDILAPDSAKFISSYLNFVSRGACIAIANIFD